MAKPFLAAFVWASVIYPGHLGAAEVVVEVSAGRHDREGVPIVAGLPAGYARTSPVELLPSDGGDAVPAQLLSPGFGGRGERETSVAWVDRRLLPAGESRRYTLRPKRGSTGDGETTVSCKVDSDDNVTVQVGGAELLRYNGAVTQPEGDGPEVEKYAVSGFIHPLRSPSGVVITDVFAPDHRHQRGVFFTWTKSRFEGRDLNFWEVQQGKGRDEHFRIESTESGPVIGAFQVRRRFIDLTAPGGRRVVLDDRWTVRVIPVHGGVFIDLESEQGCAGESPFSAGPYHYGAMAVRGRREWLGPGDGRSFSMRTSEGLGREKGNHTRPDWVDFGGVIRSRAAGMTVFSHLANARAPQFARLHPNKPYFCFFPMLEEAIEIVPGTPYRSKFRFFVYDGEKDDARSRRLWLDYSEPPKVTVSTG